MEVPLDSHTAAFIRREAGAALPRWTTIVAVTPDFSRCYQDAARAIVLTRRFAHLGQPVHLDLAAWRGEA